MAEHSDGKTVDMHPTDVLNEAAKGDIYANALDFEFAFFPFGKAVGARGTTFYSHIWPFLLALTSVTYIRITFVGWNFLLSE